MAGWESDYTYKHAPLFEEIFVCINSHAETGNKIIMPQSSLVKIISAGIPYPLFFKIRNFKNDIVSHCGVLEFVADEGCVYFPEWMMRNLGVEEGDRVILSNTALSRASFMKLQPHLTAFTEVSDPRAVLESAMRDFACLSKGDTFRVKYEGRGFDFNVLEVSPGDAVSLIDTDCMVDFAPPLDYKEEKIVKKRKKVDVKEEQIAKKKKKKVDVKEEQIVNKKKDDENKELEKVFRPFTGMSWRLDGEEMAGIRDVATTTTLVKDSSEVVAAEGKKEEEKDGRFKAFTGKSRVLGRV